MKLQKASLFMLSLVFSCLVVTGCSSSSSNTDDASIEGVLMDPSQNPMAHTSITLYKEADYEQRGQRAAAVKTTRTNQSGYYFFGGLSPNTYALVSESEEGALEVRDISISVISAFDVGNISIQLPGSVSGSATITSGVSTLNADIDVFIPGTRYAAKTNTLGEYRITGVNPGTYSVYIMKYGYDLIQVSDVTVVSGQGTIVADQRLVANSEASDDIVDGVDGADGADGEDGQDEPFWFLDSGEPGSELGIEGDYYLDTSTYIIYIKGESEWESTQSIRGEVGEDGPDGLQGEDGEEPELLAAGVRVSSFLLDLNEGDSEDVGLRLTTQPLDDVTISLDLVDPGSDAAISVSSLTFTSENWMVTQDVTITALSDVDVEAEEMVTINFSISSYDIYNGQYLAPIQVEIAD
jgi:hypothetical protein